MPGTVLLDLYGTLVEPDWTALLQGRAELAERAGVPAAAAHRAWDSTHAARMVGRYGTLADDLAAVFAAVSGSSRPTVSASLLSELADAERENWRRGVRLYPDAVPALRRLRASGMRVAIVTNASAEAASVVDVLGLRPSVDEVFASCEAGLLKPDLLEVALGGLGVDAAEATVVDDEPQQLDGAARLGMRTVLVRRSGSGASAPTGPGPHRAVTDLRQVAELVAHAEPARRR